MKKYILIDGNNLAVRHAFASPDLKNSSGISTSVHFGVFQSLILLKKNFPDYQFLMVWDGHSKRRIEESEKAVKIGIIPKIYKANRKKDDMPQPLLNFYEQSPYLKRAIGVTGIPQICLSDVEADDVINSYCQIMKKDNEIVVVTSDHDYYQLLDDNVKIFDGMKQKEITKESLVKEYGIQPKLWVDIGAFQGDDSDGIYGVPGWGEKTSLKMVAKYGSWENVINALKQMYQAERNKLPDLKDIEGGDKLFSELSEMKSEKGNFVYPEIRFDMPFTGVLYEFNKGTVRGKKAEIMALLFQQRAELAFSLKKMDCIESLPVIESGILDKPKLIEYFEYYDIFSLQDELDVFA